MTGSDTRFLIVVFDALRPDFIEPALTPNICAFMDRGVRFTSSRSTFPTETRVNQSAVTTGCYPRRHGVVANNFPLPEAAPGAVVNTGADPEFEAMLAGLGKPFLQAPTLGSLLAGAGRSLATISAGTSGGGRLINIDAERVGGFRLALRRPEAAVPEGAFQVVTERVGPPPAYKVPGIAWNEYAVACYLDYVEPALRPDVMLLWLSEPDESFHYCGIGSPESLAAIRAMDAAFGRILARQQGEIDAGRLQIIAMSDHGQISLSGGKLDLTARLNAAGFSAADTPEKGADHVAVVHSAGGIWTRDGDEALTERLAQWLQTQDWCGPIFTRDGLCGALRHRDIRNDHPRAPDIYLALAHRDDANQWGRAGMSRDNSPYPDFGGCHGGLSQYELHNFLAMGGACFGEGVVSTAPAANVDILPTMMAAMGLPAPTGIDGRILDEAFMGAAPGAPEIAEQRIFSTNPTGRVTSLSFTDHKGARYLNRAWSE